MLGFDIETTGFLADIPVAQISVLCTMDSETLEEHVYNFMAADEGGKSRLRGEVIDAFNSADQLCAYNAVMFDIPFMQKQLEIDDETVSQWLVKLCDPFHTMRTCFSTTCKLDKMLALNGMECKSGDGKKAVEMANRGDWESLSAYCMDDVRLTVALCKRTCFVMFQDELGGFFICCSYNRERGMYGVRFSVCNDPRLLHQQA